MVQFLSACERSVQSWSCNICRRYPPPVTMKTLDFWPSNSSVDVQRSWGKQFCDHANRRHWPRNHCSQYPEVRLKRESVIEHHPLETMTSINLVPTVCIVLYFLVMCTAGVAIVAPANCSAMTDIGCFTGSMHTNCTPCMHKCEC